MSFLHTTIARARRQGLLPGWTALALGLLALCSTAALAQENPDVTLQSVSRSFIEANGLPTNGMNIGGNQITGVSARGLDSQGLPQLARSGFDIVDNGQTGVVLLRGLRQMPNGSCAGLNDDAFFLVHVAGRPGDADGDGSFSLSGGTCGSRRGNSLANPFPEDGLGPDDVGIISDKELVQLKIYRKCTQVGNSSVLPDLQFSLRPNSADDASKPTILQLDKDQLTGAVNHGTTTDANYPGAKIVGGEGTGWEAGTIDNAIGDNYGQPCPTVVDGYYIMRIPNWSSYFAAQGLNAGDFSFIITTGSSDDGVGEDLVSGTVNLSAPKLSITKTPDLTLCPGAQGTYTIHVANDGNATLRGIVVTDVLPAGGSIVSSSIPASGTTGTVTFSAFDLAQCESKDITVVMQASANCHGHDVNSATAQGTFATFCGDAKGVETDTPVLAGPATANFDCKATPCVTFTLDPIAPQCEGTPVTISGTVTNCSTSAEDIIVTIAGVQHDLGQVAVGPKTFSFPAGNLTCVNGGEDFVVTATASTDCPPAITTAPQTAHVDCKAKPCVTFTLDPIPAQCEGTAVTVSGSVVNCSTIAEDVIVTIAGVQHDLGQVPVGPKTFSFPAGNLTCVNGGEDFLVSVSATTDCPPASTPAPQTVHVICKALPCVTLNLDAIPAQCEGTPVTVSGSVTNCSSVSEDIIVTIGGVQHDLGQVPVGPKTFSFPAGNLTCVNGGEDFVVTATASTDCPPAITTAPQTAHVDCKAKPCVTLDVNPAGPLCEGAAVTISGTVTNCTTVAEDIIVTINGVQHDLGQVAVGPKTWSFPAGNLTCVNGGEDFVVTATAATDCPPAQTTEPKTVHVLCSAKPCVTLVVNPLQPQCSGTPVTVTGTVTSCSTGPETIVVTITGANPVTFSNVAAGDHRDFSVPVGNLVCVNGSATYHVNATASTDCPPNDVKQTDVTIQCQLPQIHVVKTGPATANNGDTIHYVITVSNPSPDVDLEQVTVTDQLCNYVSNPRNFAGTCTAGAPVVSGKVITWPTFSLAHGGSCTISFDVTADIVAGGGQCPTSVSCPNLVHVFGFCAGSNGSSRVDDEFTLPTTIQCLVLNCPRTPGFWAAQCAQKANGSTKYSLDNITKIAECVDDHSSFFNWAAGTDLDRFCRTISPPIPMDQRKQAKRQFASLLANLCASATNNQPVRGGTITLDPSTPVNCGGLQAKTIGELITEVDNLLASLEGQNLNNGDVKAKYGAIISCIDAINNGISIPVTPDCPDGGTVTSTDNSSDPSLEAGSSASSMQLYRAFPNPFNGSTSFAYEVRGSDAAVDITVYNVAGRQVRKLVSSTQSVGLHSAIWDGRTDDGARVNRGIYFVRTSIGGSRENTLRVLYLP